MIRRGAWAGLVCATLAACTVPTHQPSVQILPDAQGLAILPSGLRIDFGRSPDGVVVALDREMGTHARMSPERCPAEIIDQKRWGDLVLSFTDEQFVGWRRGAETRGQVCAA